MAKKKREKTELRNYDAISRAHEIVAREIQKIRGPQKDVSGHVHVICPFHRENTPSCAIHVGSDSFVPAGYWYCFGCGERGPWNILAERLGLELFQKDDNRQDRVRYHNFDKLRDEFFGGEDKSLQQYADEFDAGMMLDIYKDETWRKVPGKILCKIGAKRILDTHTGDPAILLPVSVNGTIVGAVKARNKKKKGLLSYITSEGNWVKKKGLFPFDYAVQVMKNHSLKTLVLVEGPRDALRLLRYGIPAVAILGSKQWTKHKQNVVLSAADNVIIMMDSDAAGVQARKMIYGMMKSYVKPKVIRLERKAKEYSVKKMDPGNAPKEVLRKVRDLLV